jgi:ABC-type glycerol-3-phosphate transport system substrate-binding protein
MKFPYGPAPLVILLIAVITGIGLAVWVPLSRPAGYQKPDLVLATFVPEQADAYRAALPKFERENHCNIQIELVDQKALQSRLQSALQVGADVPDMVELMYGTIGVFTKGPLQDVGLIDLTDKIKSSGLYDRIVTNRLAKWSSRGHVFALPHDVHPVMLVYRRDLVQQLGIDVAKLTTWDEFARVGHQVVKESRGPDGVPAHYMLDLPTDGNDPLVFLLLQDGVGVFDAAGHVAFDSDASLDVICWYVKQIEGPGRISFPCGEGQNFAKAMIDGLCLFYFCPDWRSNRIHLEIPSLSGKLALMPLPAWRPGGLRTSTWGGCGLAFTKKCRNFDLAWKLAMYLYYDPSQLGPRFAATHILPPLKAAWNMPQFDQPDPYYSGIPLGRAYAALAPFVPEEHYTAYTTLANSKLSEAFTNVSLYYRAHGDVGLRDYARAELKRCADQVRVAMHRNVFLYPPGQKASVQ